MNLFLLPHALAVTQTSWLGGKSQSQCFEMWWVNHSSQTQQYQDCDGSTILKYSFSRRSLTTILKTLLFSRINLTLHPKTNLWWWFVMVVATPQCNVCVFWTYTKHVHLKSVELINYQGFVYMVPRSASKQSTKDSQAYTMAITPEEETWVRIDWRPHTRRTC
jgi:hypothetical protein